MGIEREKLQLPGPVGVIEAVMEYGPAPTFVAVVCHPHPLFGGTMDNKVVTTLCRTAREAGGVALRFNFRGVGLTEGSHGGGYTEAEDLLAVSHWLAQRWPSLPLWLAGFSFGSWVAVRGASARHAAGDRQHHLLLVAPAVHANDFDAVGPVGCPVTVVIADQDEVVPVPEQLDWAAKSALQPEVMRIPGASHFFHGQLTALAEIARQTFP